ncbi:MAG: excinuclease ABC subunit UvrA [Pseudomonadota bacterium]|nr:excinuclease ABC subunit UvrA [Pseudomonadota bacterium]
MAGDDIIIKGARQNNLRGLDLAIPLRQFVVITGVSGCGKSSLAFDTLYAEGQRRYMETFSPYARQFLDRMDKPRADRIEGIPPAIAIDQTNPVRTSRSTVGTMTELSDHLKLLFARAARLYCPGCGRAVRRDDPESVAGELLRAGGRGDGASAWVAFPVVVPDGYPESEVMDALQHQGYTRIIGRDADTLEVLQGRVRIDPARRERLVEALEAAFRLGRGRVSVHLLKDGSPHGTPRRFSADLHCADCDRHFRDPTPPLFSFNSPAGACPNCRGFGRVIGIDEDLVIPDGSLALARGAVKPWRSDAYRECQVDMERFARERGVPLDVPWDALEPRWRRWVIEGEGEWDEGVWYGTRRFFDWLEGRSYRMHVRVLLSKYRSYDTCPDCRGARLVPEALNWRIGDRGDGRASEFPSDEKFRPTAFTMPAAAFAGLPGLTLHDVGRLPIEKSRVFFDRFSAPADTSQAVSQLLDEIRTRLRYLVDVGLGYLTLDRQSRTLSGGEAQRINMTTALGTSLVNTLFVLDEPSIGLHPRDINRMLRVIVRLRDAGNSVVVVEHDPQVIRAADLILDLGPGPGERGGRVVFEGTPRALARDPDSITAAYLSGRKRVGEGFPPPDDNSATGFLEIRGATEHNLKGIDLRLPLGTLVCLTGLSGSGKSTLMRDVCYRALRRLKGEPTDPPGEHDSLSGHERIDEVVLVDQAPIGKTTRSNPASYVGALGAIRKLFADQPLSVERGYTAGVFSFNSGDGRCPDCGGNGFEHVEMQFLSDVYLRCQTCNGKRFRPAVLEVTLPGPGYACGVSFDALLDMTVSEALAFFTDHPAVSRMLAPLQAVGLDYLKLGQPVPTLSGGEAQRLKLAGHLAKTRTGRQSGKGKLFLFDEPTTGLHFADIDKLLRAFRSLTDAGHSLVVIEHNLDVIRRAGWIVDLGPEGGEAGGEIVCQGPPEAIAECLDSHTGAALRQPGFTDIDAYPSTDAVIGPEPRRESEVDSRDGIRIHHAREHNLKNIDVVIPGNELTVITGLSGSGKSTLAFDIVFAEGQRRYLESLNAYARQFVQPSSRPDVDAVHGIPPTVAIEQRTSRSGHRSTVATMTEIYHFLRLIWVRLGLQHCPDCDIPIEPRPPASIHADLADRMRGKKISMFAPLVRSRKGLYRDLARRWGRKGYAHLRVDGEMLPTDDWPTLDRYRDHTVDLPVGDIKVTSRNESRLRELLDDVLEIGKGTVKVIDAAGAEHGYSTRRACPGCGRGFEEPDPRLFSYNSSHGWCPVCSGTGQRLDGPPDADDGAELKVRGAASETGIPCPSCQGRRLNPEALAVRFEGLSIAALNARTVTGVEDWLRTLKPSGRARSILRDILPELRSRLKFLRRVGLPYLALDRPAPTLSGGETQRIRLAAQLGSNLRGVCYVLDEPTIGLHPRDNGRLLDSLETLKEKGNTVVIVEHDEDTIRRAGHIIDIGPGAGAGGGRIVAEGDLTSILEHPDSLTGRYLCASTATKPPASRREPAAPGERDGESIRVLGARLHNLADLDIEIPFRRLVCVTGVSGSGKSTLVRRVLYENLYRLLSARGKRRRAPCLVGCSEFTGFEQFDRVIEVDQAPIGKTPRSCPATYVGLWNNVRRLYSETQEARLRGYGPGRFSFNVKGGRCDTCEGQGIRRIGMSFLPDVRVLCEACGGARFNAETLAVRYRERSIGDVLAMSVDEAVEFFHAHPAIRRPLELMREVGLGYLTLGQQSPTLSGGEAQRIKLVAELSRRAPARSTRAGTRHGRTLYVLDEPTIGLHMADVEKLVAVLHRLVDAGHTVVVIEHNLDVIAAADWIIDLGPEGGDAGGRLVVEGTPEDVVRSRRGSHTAHHLRRHLK